MCSYSQYRKSESIPPPRDPMTVLREAQRIAEENRRKRKPMEFIEETMR